jgi:ABC-type transport system substrate-binding protein
MLPHSDNGEMPRRLSFTCLVYAEDSRFERTALLLQKQLYDVGIDMKLEPVGLLDMMDRAGRGDFDALLFELVGGKFLGFSYTFWHSPEGKPTINTGYRAADGVLERLRRSVSETATREAVADLSNVFSADPPAAFLAWQSQTRAVSRRVTIPDVPNTDILSAGLNLWRVDAGQVARR